MKILIKLALALSLLILTSCSKNPEKKILGQWEELEKPGSKVEFHDDGTLVAFSDSSPLKIKGKWNFLEDGRLKTEMITVGIQSVDIFTVSFEGEIMTAVSDDDTTILTKIESH